MMRRLPVTAITVDAECQPRVAISGNAVDDYASDMAEGAEFPPLTVYHDGATYWLADGFHRLAAAMQLGLAEINCDVRQGGKRDAILFAAGANTSHGLRRTSGDKRRAIETILNDPEWSGWADNKIARICGCHHEEVRRVKSSLAHCASEDQKERTYTTKHGTVATMKTANIGRSTAAPAPSPIAPSRLSATEAAFLFGDDDDEPDAPIPPAVEWTVDDEKAFADVSAAIRLVDRDAKAVAYAAAATNPIGAKLALARAEQVAVWHSRFIHELRSILG